MPCHSHLEMRKQGSGRLNVLSKEPRATGPSLCSFHYPTLAALLVFTPVQKGHLAHCQWDQWKKKFTPFGDQMTRQTLLTGSNSGWASDPEHLTGMATFA